MDGDFTEDIMTLLINPNSLITACAQMIVRGKPPGRFADADAYDKKHQQYYKTSILLDSRAIDGQSAPHQSRRNLLHVHEGVSEYLRPYV